jgi:hypothetical protein
LSLRLSVPDKEGLAPNDCAYPPRLRALEIILIRMFILLAAGASLAYAQGNYEIQVYGADTVAPGNTMVELHSNFTAEGSRATKDGTYPTDHQEHETVEITQGLTNWFETGFYIFTSVGPNGQGYKWVGDHIRPRVRVPDEWKWPVGFSISTEVGYQRPIFSKDTWTWEIRPIVDKQLGPWYVAFNPALERSWHGPSVHEGVTFAPAVKLSYQFNQKIAGGFEYYGDTGLSNGFGPVYQQQQDFFPAVDVDFGPQWEFNFGVGVGATRDTDHLIIKAILGRRFDLLRRRTP